MKYKAYPEYKDSGVEWLGDIPKSWSAKKISYVALLQSGDGIVSDQIKSMGKYPVYGGNGLRGYTDNYNHEGHYILIGRQGALCGNINYGYDKFWASEHAVVVHPMVQLDTFFLGETLRAMDLNQYNVSAAQPGLAVANITCLKVPFPPIEEQNQIAAFLDRETAKMDTLIDKQKKLIALLKEKRQATLSHAVTKGLNPDAPMKDSGVEWLGKIPAHWEVIQIKHLSPVKRGASPRPIDDQKYFDEQGEYAWVRIADVSKSGMYLTATTQRLSDLGASLSIKLEANQLFISIAGTVGKPCITTAKACIHDGFVYFPELSINNKFLFYIFEAGEAYLGLGKMGTQLNLNTDTVGGIKIGLPPKSEIEAIITFIEQANSKFDNLISKAEQAIELIQERRTALISAAVTGKIDVRHHASCPSGEQSSSKSSSRGDL